ncbi:MAG TPA: glycosyltransferase family 4 protein [Terriglobales bacterium]|nr:glycosyltransferase family 4 protein [Terriglobales bacterium]
MRIALIAPPFVCVPPKRYGGTELFIACLAAGLQELGHEVVVYANGESTVNAPLRWLYEKPQWPIQGEIYDNLKDLNHTAWAVADAAAISDVIHLNNAPGVTTSRFVDLPFVYTMHHPHDDGLTEFYSFFPNVNYVTISHFQRQRETLLANVRTIHHGIDISQYRLEEKKEDYLVFIGRLAPVKGPHLAIEVAKKAGIPLKIAGEVQPIFQDYYEQRVKPHVDGRFIEYVGEADLEAKNELLGKARAMLFPIQWDEPFGLVLIESMACGTPVLALPGGSVREIVCEGVSGYVCQSVGELAQRARELALPAVAVRQYVESNFSLDRMVRQYAELYEAVAAGAPAAQLASTAEETSEDEFPQQRAVA